MLCVCRDWGVFTADFEDLAEQENNKCLAKSVVVEYCLGYNGAKFGMRLMDGR